MSGFSLGVPQNDVYRRLSSTADALKLLCRLKLSIRQHFMMNPLHSLEFSLDSIPVRFQVLHVNTCDGINKIQVVDHLVQLRVCLRWLATIQSSALGDSDCTC